MSEKVIHEVRFVETEDGFRIEVKGDKERLREMGFGPGMMGFGPGMHFGQRHHRHHHGHGRRRRFRFAPDFGPWAWWGDWDDEPADDEPHQKPPQEV